MQFRNYNYDEKEVTALCFDDYGNGYIWIAFAKNDENKCLLYKTAPFNLYQTYFEIEYEVDRINRIIKQGSYLYMAIEDETYFGYRTSITSPTTYNYTIAYPSGINESPIDVVYHADDGRIYFLTPGSASGEVAKVCKFSTSGTYYTTINLTAGGEDIHDAVSLVSDETDLWVIAKTDPTKLVRIETDTGTVTITDLTKII